MANKVARMAWAMMVKGTDYDPFVSPAGCLALTLKMSVQQQQAGNNG
jgi:hypothetical protein